MTLDSGPGEKGHHLGHLATAHTGSLGMLVSICGKLWAALQARPGRMRTRTSYQPAWPVMGSELLMVLPHPLGALCLFHGERAALPRSGG